MTLKIDFVSQKFEFGKRYEIDLRVIFYQWPKLGLGLDVEAKIQILKVIQCVWLDITYSYQLIDSPSTNVWHSKYRKYALCYNRGSLDSIYDIPPLPLSFFASLLVSCHDMILGQDFYSRDSSACHRRDDTTCQWTIADFSCLFHAR